MNRKNFMMDQKILISFQNFLYLCGVFCTKYRGFFRKQNRGIGCEAQAFRTFFARIVSNLQQYGLSIAEARIHTGRDGRVVDSFIVVDDGSDPNFEQEFARFQEILAEKLDLAEKLPPPLRGRPSRQSKLFPISPQASLRPDAAGRQYMLSIVTTDRLGLFGHPIARVFVQYGINLVTARITTLGERAEDVFLIEKL